MTAPLKPGKRKNPILKTRSPNLPPWGRSRVALRFTAGAAVGKFELQVCEQCGTTQYPPRELCCACLSDDLVWKPQSGHGVLLSHTTLQHSNDLFFRERLPWRLGLVQLAEGPVAVVHVHSECGDSGAVRIKAQLDRAGQGILVALPEKDTPNMWDEKMMREFSCDPKLRRVLVTDGKTPVGQAMVRAMLDAGASLVWVGHAEPWKNTPGFDELKSLDGVSLQPLDVTDAKSVKELAGEIGGRVDIVVNTAEVHRSHSISSRYGTDVARLEMDVN
ncbi:MAG: OB-fold domain-containing protein, partial [Pseudomonadota bacterium]